MPGGRPRKVVPDFVLRPTPDGIFEVRWTEGGRTRRRSTGTRDRNAAETFLRRHVAEHHLPKRAADPLLADLIDAYLKDHVPRLASPDSQRHALARIRERLGDFRPDELTEPLLADYATWRRGHTRRNLSGTVKDGTVAREVNALRAVLGWSARNRLLSTRPEIRLPVAHPDGRQRTLSTEEVTRLLQTVRRTLHLDLFVRIALATAARRSAILELTWDRVIWPESETPLMWRGRPGDIEYQELAHGLMLDMGRGVGNKRRATVPIGNNAPLYLRLRRAQEIAKTEFVIEFRGKRVADVKTGFIKACRLARIEDCTPHVLKHTSVSWMVRRGMPLAVISKLTGTSQATLEQHYSHLSPAMAEAMGDLFSL